MPATGSPMSRMTLGARPTFNLPAVSSGRIRLRMGPCQIGASLNLSRRSWPKPVPSPENVASFAWAPVPRVQRRLGTGPHVGVLREEGSAGCVCGQSAPYD